jgi:RNA polymerase sigma-70 factor (ECF subfamily)
VIVHADQAVSTLSAEDRADSRPTLAAFDELVERYQSPLRRFLYGLVQDYELAADLSQETFLSAYRGLPRLELQGQAGEHLDLSAWLYTIALNQARGVLRRRRILRWVPFMGASPERAASSPDIATAVVMRDELRGILERLPVDQRACLLLHADGFRYSEIAKILGCSLPAVKLRILRGRQRCLELYRTGNPQDGIRGKDDA